MGAFWRLQAVLIAALIAVGLLAAFSDGSNNGPNAVDTAGADPTPGATGLVSSSAPSAAVDPTATATTNATTIAPGQPAPNGTTVATTPPANATADDPATSLAAQRSATLLFTGDLLPHAAVQRQAAANGSAGAYDFGPMFDEVRGIISGADLAICHLETPLSADSTNLSSYPVFNSPGELAANIADAGYDGCSLASNHAYDKRNDGVNQTVGVMVRNQLGFAGMARTQAEHDAVRLYDVNGISVAHLSYTYGLNGFVLPGDKPYLVNVIEPATIVAEAQRARDAGADFVVLSMHWGSEYQQQPNAEQVALADRLLPDANVDLIIGHHAHVVQPWDQRGDEVVVYGLGNFLSNQSANCCIASTQDGVMAKILIEEQSDGGFAAVDTSYVATWVDRSDYTIVPVAETLASGQRANQADTLRTSQGRTASAVVALGADAWGARPADSSGSSSDQDPEP